MSDKCQRRKWPMQVTQEISRTKAASEFKSMIVDQAAI
jgi:hypothetical protein